MSTPSKAFLGSALLVAAFSVACSSSKTDQAQSPAGSAGSPADARPSIGPYPSEPYGNAVGDTLTNLQLQGYLNEEADAISNTKPFVES